MKLKKTTLIIGVTLFALGNVMISSCGNDNQNTEETHEHAESGEHNHEHSSIIEGEKAKDLSLILESYFQVKNALVKDNAKAAAEASEKLLSAFNRFDMTAVAADKMKEYMEIIEDAIENAEHISKNADKIEHQREHFIALSEDMNDLIGLIGTNKKLYLDFCPMVNNGKGATWISEIKKIQNPYMGSKMPTCGKIQKEW